MGQGRFLSQSELQRVSAGVAAVWIALLFCLVLSVVDNLRVRSQLSDLLRTLQYSVGVPLGPAPGVFEAIDSQGRSLSVAAENPGERPVIAFVASGGCPHCRDSMARWRELASARSLNHVQFILMRLDAALGNGRARFDPGTFDPETFSFPERPDLAWTRPSRRTVVAYNLRWVPQTIVARNGEIEFVKTGKLNQDDVSRIRRIVQPSK